MTRLPFFLRICFFSLCFITCAFGEGEESSAFGKVTSKSSSAITVTTEDKKNPNVTFVIDENTSISRGRTKITVEAIESGEMARVVGMVKGDQKIATSITVRQKP